MDYNSNIIKVSNYRSYQAGNKDAAIYKIWLHLLEKLSAELKIEAQMKGFELIEVDRKMDLINLKIVIPDASPELYTALANLNPFIICE